MSEPSSTEVSVENRNKDRRINKRRAAAIGLLAIGALSILKGVEAANHETDETREVAAALQEQLAAGEAIAERYDCSLASIEDAGQTPSEEEAFTWGDAEKRTTLSLDIDYEITPEAQAAMQEYAADEAPVSRQVHAPAEVFLHEDSEQPAAYGEGLPFATPADVIADEFAKNDTEDQLKRGFIPKNTYSDGTRASVYVSPETSVADIENAQRVEMQGHCYAGEIVIKDGKWGALAFGDEQYPAPKSPADIKTTGLQ